MDSWGPEFVLQGWRMGSPQPLHPGQTPWAAGLLLGACCPQHLPRWNMTPESPQQVLTPPRLSLNTCECSQGKSPQALRWLPRGCSPVTAPRLGPATPTPTPRSPGAAPLVLALPSPQPAPQSPSPPRGLLTPVHSPRMFHVLKAPSRLTAPQSRAHCSSSTPILCTPTPRTRFASGPPRVLCASRMSDRRRRWAHSSPAWGELASKLP